MVTNLIRAARVASWGALVVVAGCMSSQFPPQTFRTHPTPLSPALLPIRTIVVDAGHGGADPGTAHYGLREKDLTLDIARRLYTELHARGLSVVMTRDRDEFIALSHRSAVANRLPADLFVSVHVNANPNRGVSGVEVYYPRETVVRSAAAFPPRVQPTEIAIPTVTMKRILWDLVLTRSRHHSARMARQICRALRSRLAVPCRGIRGARFVVLREAMVPAVLVEVGYVTNRQEASRLASPSYRQAIGQAIADGITSYVQELELQYL